MSRTPRKKARGREAQFPFRLNRERAYATQSAKAKPPAIAAKHDDPDDRTAQQPYGGHGKAGAPKAPAKGVHSIKIASVDKDNLDNNNACMGATKPALLRASAAAAIRGEVGARCGDGGAGMCPDDGVMAAA